MRETGHSMNIVFNLESVFRGFSAEEALFTLGESGFDVFERWTIRRDELVPLQQAMTNTGTRIKACCPECFILNDPGKRSQYTQSLTRAVETIQYLSGDQLITQVGADTGLPREVQHHAIVDGLRSVKGLLEREHITLLIEPLNTVKDHPGYYLTSSDEGFEIIREVDSPNVRLLYDVYHQLHMGEDVLSVIRENLPLIGHFHIAGFPARDEKIFDGFDYRLFFDYINAQRIDIPVGIELFPSDRQAILPLLRSLAEFV